MFHSIIIAGFPASWWWVYTPTELGVFGGSGDFGCFDCFGGFHDLLPMLRHCTPPARGFRCSKHGFCVLEALQQPDFPPKPCLAGMRHGEPIEASVGQQQPTPTPQPCRTFAKHGFHSNQSQNPRGNSPLQLNTMLRRIEALAGHRSNTQNQVASKTDKHGF